MLKKIAFQSARFPKSVMLATLAITLGALFMLGDLKIDANPYPLSRSHPSMVALQKLKSDYTGTLEMALIHLRHPVSVYNADTFRRIEKLTEGLEELTLTDNVDVEVLSGFLPLAREEIRLILADIITDGITRDDDQALTELEDLIADGVEVPAGLPAALEEIQLKLYPIKEVTSLSTVENITSDDDQLIVGEVYKTIPSSPSDWEKLRADIRSNDVFIGVLISEDEQSTGIQAETYIPDIRSDLMYTLDQSIRKLLQDTPGEEQAYLAGFAFMGATFTDSIQKDNARLFPVVVVLVVLALLLTFRTFGGVLLPLAVVIISIIWTMGIMVLVHVPLNMMTTMLPVFLIAIGVADGVHIVSDFKDRLRASGDRLAAVHETMSHMTMPVVMTSLTTAAGFISLSFTDIDVIQKFGIFVATGVMAAMVFSLTFIPAALTFGRRKQPPTNSSGGSGRFRALENSVLNGLVAISDFSIRRNRLILTVSVVMVIASAVGLTRIQTDNDFLTYFPEDRPIVQSSRSLDEHMAGSNIINILVGVPNDREDPFKEPKYLAAVDKLQQFIDHNPIVGKSLSLVDVLKRINLVLHNNDQAFNRLPNEQENLPGGRTVSGRKMVAQYLLLYGNGGGDNLSDNMDADFATMNISTLLNTQNSGEIGNLIREVQQYAAQNFPAGMTVSFAGSAEMAITTNNEIVKTQITSLSISVVVVFLLLLIQFRSLSKGLLAILPLAVTLFVNFGLLGLLGINLNIAIAVISSIVIGIGVDFAIHYLSRLQEETKRGRSQQEVFAATMRASGKAITANAFIVALGFLALLRKSVV